ncbi:MAG: type II toxin-antitoxin system prevent-host-death family antitoxin [Synechococcaceae cyanobacterium]|nr:type II toxin-antitoxin system prevent-host-death family antitoxin [Synechococcaceae cyanobacterium]
MSISPPGPRQVNVQEAKTHLSALLLRVEAGEEIVLARNGRPCARLVPLRPAASRRLGFLQGSVDDAFFEPLPERELAAWEA